MRHRPSRFLPLGSLSLSFFSSVKTFRFVTTRFLKTISLPFLSLSHPLSCCHAPFSLSLSYSAFPPTYTRRKSFPAGVCDGARRERGVGDKMQHTTNVSPFLPFLHYACVRACLRAREAETAAYIPRLGSAGCCESHVLLPAPLHTAPHHHHHHHYPRGSRCVSQRTEADVSKQKKKKETHTPSATCQRRFLNKKPTIVFCSRCRSPLSAVTISATTGLGKVEVYAVCAQLSAGSGSGWSANTSSPTWLQQGGVRLGCRVEAVGQWQAAVAAAPPDILHNKSLDSVQFSRVNPKHRAFAMLKLSNFWSRF